MQFKLYLFTKPDKKQNLNRKKENRNLHIIALTYVVNMNRY